MGDPIDELIPPNPDAAPVESVKPTAAKRPTTRAGRKAAAAPFFAAAAGADFFAAAFWPGSA